MEDGRPRLSAQAARDDPDRDAGLPPGRGAQGRGRRPDRQGRAAGDRDRGRGGGGAGVCAGDGVRVEEVKESRRKMLSFFLFSLFVFFVLCFSSLVARARPQRLPPPSVSSSWGFCFFLCLSDTVEFAFAQVSCN